MKYQVYRKPLKTLIPKNRKPTNASMQPALTRLGHMLLALNHHLKLVTNLLQPAQHLLIPIRKPQNRIFNSRLRAKLLD